MKKNLKKMIITYSIFAVTLPFILNFMILFINFIPSVGNNLEMMGIYASYFGGVIGGLATLITIYFAFIQSKDEKKPILVFENSRFFFYRGRNGSKISNNIEIYEDSIIKNFSDVVTLELHNIGLHSAIDVELTICDKEVYLDSIKKLKLSKDMYDTVDKSFTKENDAYLPASMLKSNKSIKLELPVAFDHLMKFIIYIVEDNKKNDIGDYNPIITDSFKIFDFKVDYKDIDNNKYSDLFSVNLRYQNLELGSTLKDYVPWMIRVEFNNEVNKSVINVS